MPSAAGLAQRRDLWVHRTCATRVARRNWLVCMVYMDTIYPSSSFMNRRISGDAFILNNRSFRDVAGIKWILVSSEEVNSFPPQVGFKPPLIYKGREKRLSLALFENPNAWPRAVFIDPGIKDIKNYRVLKDASWKVSHVRTLNPFRLLARRVRSMFVRSTKISW